MSHIGTLKVALEEVFIPWKLVSAAHQLVTFLGLGRGWVQGKAVKPLPAYHCRKGIT